MLTICPISGGDGYADRHLRYSDYYDEGHVIQGTWCGHGAEMLGLSGTVTSGQFEALRQGRDPATGEFLRPRRSSDRLSADGRLLAEGRALYDLTFSAPKSVSIMALLGGDLRLLTAHDEAVDEALNIAESLAAVRVRRNTSNFDRITGNWIGAVYRHTESRLLDPQVHSHCPTFNLTYDAEEGCWKALQISPAYDDRAFLTEVYRNALARKLRSFGYQIKNRTNAKGKDLGFEICGLGQDLLEKFSQRSKQRDEAIAEFTEINGRTPTDNEVAVLVRQSRSPKLTAISTADVRQLQIAKLTPEDILTIKLVHDGLGVRSVEDAKDQSEEALNFAQRHVFERQSVASEQVLFEEALRHGRGCTSLEHLRASLSHAVMTGSLIRAEGLLTTRENIALEKALVSMVDSGIGKYPPLCPNDVIQLSAALREEQARAVAGVVSARDFAVNLQGAAGTGKTVTLGEIRNALERANRRIVAVAPTTSAVEELKKVGFPGAMTITRLVQDQNLQAGLHKVVLLIDEAGMVSGRQMEKLLRLARTHDARVIFAGDTRQIPSIEACDALRLLECKSGLANFSLLEVQRQIDVKYRDAVQTLRQSVDRGLERFDHLRAFHNVTAVSRSAKVAELYRRMTSTPKRKVLVVAGTHAEIDDITGAIRHDLSQRGILGKSEMIEHYFPLSFTQAQKQNSSSYRPGQVLVFHRSLKGIKKYDSLRVIRTQSDCVVAVVPGGEEISLSPMQSNFFSVYGSCPIEVGRGDHLLLHGNRKDHDFRATNGEIVRVRDVQNGRITLDDGRVLPADYREFSHGYAVTAHKSQGKTVDAVIVSADGMGRDLFYVAVSRGRKEIAIVTSDQHRLRQHLDHAADRPMASDLAAKPADHLAVTAPAEILKGRRKPQRHRNALVNELA